MGRREANPAKFRFSTAATRRIASAWPTTRPARAASIPSTRSRSLARRRDSGIPATLATTWAISRSPTARAPSRCAREPARSSTATALSGRKRSVTWRAESVAAASSASGE